MGIDATPMRFLRSATTVGQGATSATGTLPATDEEALARINAQREGQEPLTLADVFIHYAEAANSNFIEDRYAFLSSKTLKNIARAATAGFAFMNSHRTGGLSSPSELPYGRTFCGRYERLADGSERALIGFYMLARLMGPNGDYALVYPNGQGGPSTADMHAGIEAGTIFDVSVGLHGGQAICDVCGGDLSEYYDCDHFPGTTWGMTDEEIQAQKDRGVSDGCASYTLDDCGCGETSAVYDGAVPGAGFSKTFSAMRKGKLSGTALAQARRAYAPLLAKGDQMDGNALLEAIEAGFVRLAAALGGKQKGAEDASRKDANLKKSANLAASAEPEEKGDEGDTPPADPTEGHPLSHTSDPEPDPPTEEPEPGAEADDAEILPPAADETFQETELMAHPVLSAALSAGIDSEEKLAATIQQAKDGRSYLAALREEAKRFAVVAFGNDQAAKVHVLSAHALIDEAATLDRVKSLSGQYRSLAVKQGLQNEDGTAKDRKSVSADLPEFANDVKRPEQSQLAIVEPVESVFERRKKQVLGPRG